MAMETVFYDGRPIFEAANSKELAKAVEAFDDDVKPPYVVRIPEGATEVVGGYFFCSDCRSLTTLNGAPKDVGGYFNCANCNLLVSLDEAPKNVGSSFIV